VPSEDRKTAELRDLAESVLPAGRRLEWKALVNAIIEARSTAARQISSVTAQRTVERMREAKIIGKEWSAYFLIEKQSS
jgi:hypothetical protein